MDLSDFDFFLPTAQIAQHPPERRDGSRLLHLNRARGSNNHTTFDHFPTFLNAEDALVLNQTRVFPARLRVRRKNGGGGVELLLTHRDSDGCWQAIGKPTKRLKRGDTLYLTKAKDTDAPALRVVETKDNGGLCVRFEDSAHREVELIHKFGEVPLPPYLQRAPVPKDVDRYQTVYAQVEGAVAAPTAGLHFTEIMLKAIRTAGVAVIPLTLNVGPGTFQPVRSSDPRAHQLDPEWYELEGEAAAEIRQRKRAGGRVIAVGTTTVRTLETLADDEGVVRSGSGWTSVYILPSYRFRVVDALLTNFHLPRSTLLMLVAAFAGTETVLGAYREAVRVGYRFYSYGDAMFIS